MKYRLVKVIKANGFTMWVIQKKFLFWWESADSYIDEEKAQYTLMQLRDGVPLEKRIVVK